MQALILPRLLTWVQVHPNLPTLVIIALPPLVPWIHPLLSLGTNPVDIVIPRIPTVMDLDPLGVLVVREATVVLPPALAWGDLVVQVVRVILGIPTRSGAIPNPLLTRRCSRPNPTRRILVFSRIGHSGPFGS